MRVVVKANRPDGSQKYRWFAEVLAQDDEEILVAGVFGREHRAGARDISPGDTTVEHYPFGRWYNICRIYRSGRLLGIYCNLATPPDLAAGVLSFVDLELDLFVHADGRYVMLDLEAFEWLATTALSAGTARAALADWAQLVAQVEQGQGVFAETRGPLGG